MQKSITLDLVIEDEAPTTEATQLGEVTFKLIEKYGPAGGNPVYELTGEDGALLIWLLQHYTQGDVEDALYILTGVEQ